MSQLASADHETQDFDVVMPFAPDPDRPATSGLARIDDALPMEAAFARQVRAPRRIAQWTGATLVLLSLLVIGVFEFGQEGQVGRLLDALGVSRGAAVGDGDTVSASAVGTAAPAPPPITADAASAKPMPTEPAVAEPAASSTAPTFPPSSPVPDARFAQPQPTGPAVADAPGPAPPAGADGTTQSAAAAAVPADLPASAQPPAAVAPARKRATQQQVARAPGSPREVCGPRTQFSLYRCMKLQCSQRRWTAHAQCQRLRVTDSVD